MSEGIKGDIPKGYIDIVGNIAQQFQTVSNMCILGETYVRRVTVDCGTELPEVIIR